MNSVTGQTRKPFRLAAFGLCLMFSSAGIYQFFSGLDGVQHFVVAIGMLLTGVYLGFSALSGERSSGVLFSSFGTTHPKESRYASVDPIVTESVIQDSSGDQSTSVPTPGESDPSESINPYEPPTTSVPAVGRKGPSNEDDLAELQRIEQKFWAGQKIIHYGVVFFMEPGQPGVIHAALPLLSSSEQSVKRNVDEAVRVLPELLATLPFLKHHFGQRRLTVRMVESYDDLTKEVSNRIVCDLDESIFS